MLRMRDTWLLEDVHGFDEPTDWATLPEVRAERSKPTEEHTFRGAARGPRSVLAVGGRVIMKTHLIFFLVVVGFVASGCHRDQPAEGPAEKAGAKIDKAADDTKDAAKDTKDDVKKDLDK